MGDETTLPDPNTGTAETADSGEQTVIVEGQPVTVDAETTVSDLKELVGADQTDVALFQQDGRTQALNDDDRVAEYLPDQGKGAFQAGKKQPFGGGDDAAAGWR